MTANALPFDAAKVNTAYRAALDVIAPQSITGHFTALRRWDGDAKVAHLLARRAPGT